MNDEKMEFVQEHLLKKISSKELEKLLVLMESKKSSRPLSPADIRKLSMLSLSLLITNPLSKIYFLEKCGLPLIDGKVGAAHPDLPHALQVPHQELQAIQPRGYAQLTQIY
jgi:hypothetical protein